MTPIEPEQAMKTMNTPKTMQALMMSALIALMMLLVACGDSEVYYAADADAPGPVEPTINVDGKGDVVIPEDKRPTMADFQLSGSVLRFDGEGQQAMIALESADVMEAFGQGGTLLKHVAEFNGVTINWDGEPTEIYVRSRTDRFEGQWEQAQVRAEQNGSYRVYFESAVPANSLDVFVVNPEGIDFMLIEPVYPE